MFANLPSSRRHCGPTAWGARGQPMQVVAFPSPVEKFIRHYVILEIKHLRVTIFERQGTETSWRAVTLTSDDILRMPELSIEIPVAAFYEAADFGNKSDLDEAPAR